MKNKIMFLLFVTMVVLFSSIEYITEYTTFENDEGWCVYCYETGTHYECNNDSIINYFLDVYTEGDTYDYAVNEGIYITNNDTITIEEIKQMIYERDKKDK